MKKWFSLLVALIACCAACACAEGGAQPVEPSADAPVPPFTLTINGATLTEQDFADCPLYKATAVSVNSYGTEKKYEYVGYALADALALAGITEGVTAVEAIADDGYTIACDAALALEPTTLLAFLRDGEPYEGGLWFAPCSSDVTGDYLKRTVEIRADAAAAQPSEEDAADAYAPELSDKTGKIEFAPFSFLVNGAAVNNVALAGQPIFKANVTVTNSKGETVEATYGGYRLRDVLTACGVPDASDVTVIASDGYETQLDAQTVQSEYTLIAIEKDKATGEDGSVWLAPCEATESKAYLKLVVELLAK